MKCKLEYILCTQDHCFKANKTLFASKLLARKLFVSTVFTQSYKTNYTGEAMPPKPRKPLDSTRLQNSLRANILNLVSSF